MDLNFKEMIYIELKRQGLTLEQLSRLLGYSRQNLNQKLNRETITKKDMIAICNALQCDLIIDIKPKK